MANKLTENERRTIDECLRNLRAFDGLVADFTPAETNGSAGRLHLAGPWGELDYEVVARLRLSAASAETTIHQLRTTETGARQAILLSDYLGDDIGNRLRREGLDFLDAAGNAHLSKPPLYVEVSGRKQHRRQLRSGRAFQLAGLKLIFLLLRVPQAVRWTYRELAAEAGIALGAVGPTLAELNELGYLAEDAAPYRQLYARNDLLQRWQLGYSERLRPKLLAQTCRLADGLRLPQLEELIRQQNFDKEVLVGGEFGAALLLQSGHAQSATLHLNGDPLRTMLRLQLIPDPNGTITLVRQFGTTNHWLGWHPEGIQLADPLLLHAETIQQAGDERLPDLIFRRYIEPRLAGESPE